MRRIFKEAEFDEKLRNGAIYSPAEEEIAAYSSQETPVSWFSGKPKRIVAFALAASLTVAFAGFFLWRSGSGRAPTAIGTLTEINGAITVSDGRLSRQAGVNMSVYPGDTVQTEQNASAEFRWKNGSVMRLRSESQVAFLDHTEKEDLYLARGHISLNMVSVEARRFSIATPSAIVEITGTRVDLKVKENRSQLEVISGKALLTSIASNESREVSPGRIAAVSGTGLILENPSRVTRGLAAMYDFRESRGFAVPDISSAPYSCDLKIRPNSVEWTPAGLKLKRADSVYASVKPGSSLFEAFLSPDGVTMEYWIQVPGELESKHFYIGHALIYGNNRNNNLAVRIYRRAGKETSPVTFPVPAGRESYWVHVVQRFNVHKETPAQAGEPGTRESRRADMIRARNRVITTARRIRFALEACGSKRDLKSVFASAKTPERPVIPAIPIRYRLIAVYNRMLTDEEVEQNFRAGPMPWDIADPMNVMSKPAVKSWRRL
ncbi:MAG: FecR family protein [Kiritimatiellia bacterium]